MLVTTVAVIENSSFISRNAGKLTTAGGAVVSLSSITIIIDSTFKGNSAQFGGAILGEL